MFMLTENAALLFAVALSACAVRAPSPDRERASCEACLAQGKTWQGAAGCTTNCAHYTPTQRPCFHKAELQ